MSATTTRTPATLPAVSRTVAELLGGACADTDDIFALGATSMTAVHLATRLARATGRPVTTSHVLDSRTPAALATLLDTLPVSAGIEPFAAPVPAGDRPLPPSLHQFWHLADAMPNQQEALVPLLYALPATVDVPVLRAALDAVVVRHQALRGVVVPDRAGGLSVRVLPPAEVTGLLMVGTGAPRDHHEAVVEATSWLLAPFGLAGTVPIRARLIRTDRGHLLAVVVQHFAMDGWSRTLFCRDLETAYRSLRAGRPAFDVPAPGFLDVFAAQQRLHAEAYEPERARVAALVRGVRQQRFPGAPADPAVFGPLEDLELPLTGEARARAGRAAARVGGTATAVMLACYVRLLRDYLGSRDFAISLPMAGRYVAAAEDCLGSFAGGTAVRLPASCDDPVELVRAAAIQLAEAVTAPVTTVADLYDMPPEATRHPLVQIYFAPQEPPPARLDLDGAPGDLVPVRPARWYAEIALEVRPAPHVGGMLRYRTDIIARSQARRLVADWIADVEHVSDLLLRS